MTTDDTEGPRPRRWFDWLDAKPTNVIIKVVAVVSLILALVVGARQYAFAGCLARYNDRAAVAQQARIEAAEQDRAAQDAMFRAVVEDPRHSIEAIRAYTEQREQANQAREANPLPAPPSESCK